MQYTAIHVNTNNQTQKKTKRIRMYKFIVLKP